MSNKNTVRNNEVLRQSSRLNQVPKDNRTFGTSKEVRKILSSCLNAGGMDFRNVNKKERNEKREKETKENKRGKEGL